MDCPQATSEEATQYKKFTRLVIKNLTKREKACARHIFLKKCLESKVIPNTLIIKPPNTGGTVNPDTQNRYKICASTASLTNLRIAIKDASAEAHEQCSQYKEFLTSTLESIPPLERENLLEYVRKREPQISRKLKHTFQQKLKHLKEKHCQPIDKPNTDGYKAQPKASKNRRFMKRNKYSTYLVNRALDNSSFLLIVQILVRTERIGLSYSKIVLDNRSEIFWIIVQFYSCFLL